jgi:hypothetical protein
VELRVGLLWSGVLQPATRHDQRVLEASGCCQTGASRSRYREGDTRATRVKSLMAILTMTGHGKKVGARPCGHAVMGLDGVS